MKGGGRAFVAGRRVTGEHTRDNDAAGEDGFFTGRQALTCVC